MKKLLLALAVISMTACGGSSGSSDDEQSPVANAAPQASNVMVENSQAEQVVIGNTLSMSYQYDDAESDVEGASIFAWYRAEEGAEFDLIAGANNASYVLTTEDLGKNIKASVTPVAAAGSLEGELVYSNTTAVSTNTPPVAVNLAISSNESDLVVGSLLTADYTFSDNQRDAEGSSELSWLLIDGESVVELGNETTLRVPAEALGKSLAFEVTPIAATGALQGEPVRSAESAVKTEKLLFTAKQEVIIDIMSGLMEEQTHLFITDGTENGTTMLANLDGMQVTQPVAYGDLWLFTRKMADSRVQLMVTDGTASGTQAILGDDKQLVNLNPMYLAVVGDLVYFSGYDAEHGQELWSTDGTFANTQLVADINPGSSSSHPNGMIGLEGSVYLSAVGLKADNTPAGRELFFIDGNNAILVKDINPTGSSNPFYLTFFNDKLYFQAWDGQSGSAGGNELWSSDGGFHGTNRVKDLYPENHSYPANLTVVANDLYFTTSTTNDPNAGELWKTRGAEENTVEVGRAYHQQASQLTAFDNRLLYSAAVPDQASILWSAIAENDTGVDLTSMDSAKYPGKPVALAEQVYFSSTGTGGKDIEFYSANSADMSTAILAADMNASSSSSPRDLIKLNGLVLYTADDGENGRELWRYDGIQASIVKEFITGANSSAVDLNLPTFFMRGEF